MSPLPPAAAVLGLVAVACQAAPTSPEAGVRLRGDDEQVTLVRTATGCDADGTEIRVHDGEAHGGGWHLLPAPAGSLSLSHGADLVARVMDDPGPPALRLILDPVGVPLARISVDADVATVAGADRARIGTLDRAGGDLRWRRGDVETSTITGTDDLLLGATLLAPSSLPVAGRAVVACARLAATVPSPAK